MEIQFCYAESDYVAAQNAWILHRPWKIIRGYWYSLLILCIVTVGVIVNPQKWELDLLYGLLAVAVAIPSLLIMRWRWHRRFKQSDLANVDVAATLDERESHFRPTATKKLMSGRDSPKFMNPAGQSSLRKARAISCSCPNAQ